MLLTGNRIYLFVLDFIDAHTGIRMNHNNGNLEGNKDTDMSKVMSTSIGNHIYIDI